MPASVTSRGRRALRFFSRIDAYLPVLADDETRRIFLDRQIEGWEHRYSRFLATDGASEPATDPADPPQAADFLLTIEGLATRRSALPSITGETRMFDAKRQKCLDNAILSLLVAADQRCPAIIGQAHLLYHAGAGSTRSNAEQALTQLKSDAQGLLNAIANAEARLARVPTSCQQNQLSQGCLGVRLGCQCEPFAP